MKSTENNKSKRPNTKKIKTSNKNQFTLLLGIFIITGFITISFSISNDIIKTNDNLNIPNPESLASLSLTSNNNNPNPNRISCNSISDCGPNSHCLENYCVRCIEDSNCNYLDTCQPDHTCK